MTGAGKLNAKFVIHTVGPIWKGGTAGEADTLGRCFKNCLRLASERNCVSIAFPAVSTGVYGYPIEAAAEVSLVACREFFANGNGTPLRDVRFVLFSEHALEVFRGFAFTEEVEQ